MKQVLLKIQLDEMMKYGLHLGKTKRLRRSRLNMYFYGIRSGFLIINLRFYIFTFSKILRGLESIFINRCKALILFPLELNTQVQYTLNSLERKYITLISKAWLPGLITNFKTYFFSLKDNGESKVWLDSIPYVSIGFGGNNNKIFYKECFYKRLPVAGVVDLDTDFNYIDYKLVANAGSNQAILSYIYFFKSTVIFGFYKELYKLFNIYKKLRKFKGLETIKKKVINFNRQPNLYFYNLRKYLKKKYKRKYLYRRYFYSYF